jgi:hypothetical protein
VETAEYAKDCGIPSVVLISDACRSIPNSPQAMKVRGSIVFPNQDAPVNRSKIDKFLAATMGMAAYEIPMGRGKQKENAFTRCLLRAFEAPDPDMIKEIVEDDKKIYVVPNRKLGKYLEREVPALLAKVDIKLDQTPDAEVLSDDDVYIGRVQVAPAIVARGSRACAGCWPPTRAPQSRVRRAPADDDAPRRTQPFPVVHLRDVAAFAVASAFGPPPPVSASMSGAINAVAATSGFDDAMRQARTLADVHHFETETGVTVLGASIADAVACDGAHVDILEPGNGKRAGVVRIDLQGAACSFALRFPDGRGTVLAGLRGFIAHVMVDPDGVASVSYVPSDNSWRWDDYKQRRDRIDALRATVAAAIRLHVFRLDDKTKARHVAERIRVMKGLDPSLGLYAAYAFSEADRRDDVQSVRSFLVGDLGADLFDVALLAVRRGQWPPAGPVVPFCPMLTQGWNILRARAVELPTVLDDAQDELEPALWTTFKPPRTEIIFAAIRGGEIQ